VSKVLYGGLTAMVLLFAAAMSFCVLSVYDNAWYWGFTGAGILMAFGAFGGLFVPTVLKSLSGGELRSAKAFLQLFGSIIGLLFFTMATICWILGKRYIGPSNAYTALGVLIFLGFAGVGLQGVMAMAGYFAYVHNDAVTVPARLEAARHNPPADHTDAHGGH
jgi:hypothetical protein